LSKCQDALSVLRGNEQGRSFGQNRICSLQLFHLGQLLIPVPFQTASYQPIVWIDCCVATARQVGLLLRSFEPELPLPIKLLGTSFQLIKRGERNGQVGGLNGFQEACCDRLINAVAAHRLAGLLCQLRMSLPAFIAGNGAIGEIAHMHASAADATQHDPLQQCRSFAGDSTPFLWSP
jgi:hypothetical protein